MEIKKTGNIPPELKAPAKPEKAKAQEKEEAIRDKVSLKPSALKKAKAWVNKNIRGYRPQGSGEFQPLKLEELATYTGAAIGGAVGTVAGMAAGYKELQKDEVSLVWKEHAIQEPSLRGYHHNIQEQGHWEKIVVGREPGHWETQTVGHDENGNPITERVYHEGKDIIDERYEVDGYWHRFSPDLKYKTVGSYQTPEYHHKGLDPLTGGALGLITGTLVGAILGVITGAISRTVHEKGENH